jgi:hypothetical protein
MKGAGWLFSAFFLIAGCAQPALPLGRPAPHDMAPSGTDLTPAVSGPAADLAGAAVDDLSSSPDDLAIAPDLAQCLPTGAPCTFLGRGACCSHFCVDATNLCK